MSAFLTKLQFEDDGGFPFTLLTPLVYRSDRLQRAITVPFGFRTDLASIPRVLWNVLPPIGKYDPAAVLHDYLYVQNGVTRADADGVLKEAMQVCGVGWFTRQTIWLGVRVGGWVPWNRYRATAQPV